MLEPLGDYAKRERLHPRERLGAVLAITEHAGQRGHIGHPATVGLDFELDGEGHASIVHAIGLPNKLLQPTVAERNVAVG